MPKVEAGTAGPVLDLETAGRPERKITQKRYPAR